MIIDYQANSTLIEIPIRKISPKLVKLNFFYQDFYEMISNFLMKSQFDSINLIEYNGFSKESTRKLIWQNIQERGDTSFFHTVRLHIVEIKVITVFCCHNFVAKIPSNQLFTKELTLV